MATPPVLVTTQAPTLTFDTSTPRSIASTLNVSVGDLLVVMASTEDQATTISTPTATGVTFTLQQTISVSGYCAMYVWTGPITTANSALSVSAARGGNSGYWGFRVYHWGANGGVGASAKTNVLSGAPSLSLTTAGANSAVICTDADWLAASGASRTWRTVNSITPTSGNGLEKTYFNNANTTAYGAYWNDAGAAGAQTYGLTAPGSQKYSIVAIEVKGTAGGSFSGTAASSSTATTTAGGVVGAVATAALAAAVAITAAGVVGTSSGASINATGTVTASGSLTSGASLSPIATVASAGVVGVSAGATSASTATLTTAGTVGAVSGAALSATDAITATGTVGRQTGVTLAATGAITAAGSVGSVGSGSAAYVGTVTIAATGVVATSSGTSLAATGTIAASGVVGASAAASVAATGALTATGSVVSGSSSTAAIGATVTILTGGTVAGSGAASLPSVASFAASGVVGRSTASSLSAAATITAAGSVVSANDGVPIDNPRLTLTVPSSALALDPTGVLALTSPDSRLELN